MKKLLLQCAGMAVLGLLSAQSVWAQEEKDKGEKGKKEEHQEVVILKKDGKDSKITVEFKNGEVYINGKKPDEFKDENISVTKHRITTHTMPGRVFARPRIYSHTMPDAGSYNFNWNGDAPGAVVINSNKAFLGVVTEKTDKGLKITDVTKESGAEKAGLKADDIIVKIGDTKVETPMDLTKAIGKYKPEDKVDITYLRDGKESKAVAVLGKNKVSINRGYTMRHNGRDLADAMAPLEELSNFDFNFDNNLAETYSGMGFFRPRLGMAVQETEDGKGVKVLSVEDESAAEKAGLKEGDIITEFDGKAVKEADELGKWMRENGKDKTSVQVKYTRDGKAQTAEIKIPKKLKKANL
jgi:serine protease Do